MSMSWGGFAAGINQGLNLADRLGAQIDKAKVDKVRADAMEEARQARANAISGMIKDNGIGAPPQDTSQPKTGQSAPDTQDVQTSAVPTPTTTVTSAPLPPPVASPQDAADQGGPKPIPVALPSPSAPQGAPQPVSTPTASAAPASPAAPTTALLPMKRFSVGDRSFDTHQEALDFANQNAPSANDFFMKNAVPRISQAYLEQGNPEMAEAWDKYAKDKASQKQMQNWGNAYKSYSTGDFVGAAKSLIAMHGDLPDGNTIVGADPVKDKDGNVTGFNMRVKNDQTGEERAQFVDPKALTEFGLQALSPPAMFEAVFKRQQAADVARAKFAEEAAKDNRTLQREVTVKGMDAQIKAAHDTAQLQRDKDKLRYESDLKVENLGKEEKAKLKAQTDTLKEAGYSDEDIRGMLPMLMRAGEYKKMTDPEERRAMIVTNLAKDPLFSTKTAEQKKQIIDDLMAAAAVPTAPAAPKNPPTTAPNPFVPGAPATPQAPLAIPPGKKAYRDTVTGQIVFR